MANPNPLLERTSGKLFGLWQTKKMVDPWLTEKRVDRKKTTVDRIRVVLQKGYVLYGLNLTSELFYVFYGVLTENVNF